MECYCTSSSMENALCNEIALTSVINRYATRGLTTLKMERYCISLSMDNDVATVKIFANSCNLVGQIVSATC